MENNINNLIAYYANKKREGLDYSEIRKELKLKNLDDDTISTIIKAVDNHILSEELTNANKIKGAEIRVIGYILLIGGAIATFGTLLGIIELRGYLIVAYGPMIAGFFMILTSKRISTQKAKISKKKRYFEK